MPPQRRRTPETKKAYEAAKRSGRRLREPQTLEEALEELRATRAKVIRLQKRIYTLENREKVNAQQQARRSGTRGLQARSLLLKLSADHQSES